MSFSYTTADQDRTIDAAKEFTDGAPNPDPFLHLLKEEREAASEHILVLVDIIAELDKQLTSVNKQLTDALKEVRDLKSER